MSTDQLAAAGDFNTSQMADFGGKMPDFKEFDTFEKGFNFDEVKESKPEGITDTLAGVVKGFQEQVVRAKSTRDTRLIDKVISFGGKLVGLLWGYTLKALEMAMHKFILELAAMVISAVAAAWVNKGGKQLDISTAGVSYNGIGGGFTQQTQTQPTMQTNRPSSQSNMFGDPFQTWGHQPMGSY